MVCNIKFNPSISTSLQCSNLHQDTSTITQTSREDHVNSTANKLLESSIDDLIGPDDLIHYHRELFNERTLVDMISEYPFYQSPILYRQSFDAIPLNGQQQQHFGMAPVPMQMPFEVSAIKICCLQNRISSPAYNCVGSEGELPTGEYYRAMKIGSIRSAVSLQRGRKYLVISPYHSSLTSYYRKYIVNNERLNSQRSEILLMKGRKRIRVEIEDDETSSLGLKRQRKGGLDLNNINYRDCYPWEEFEKKIMKEDTNTGKCGLYELVRIHNPTRDEIEFLKSRTDRMLIYLPEITEKTKAKPLILCACEIQRLRAIVHCELLGKVMEKLVLRLKEMNISSSLTFSSNPLICDKGKEKLVTWNFADLLSSAATEPNPTWLSLNRLLNSNSLPTKFRMEKMDFTRDYLIGEILNVRVSIISKCRLVSVGSVSLGDDESVTYGQLTFPSQTTHEFLSLLLQPPISNASISLFSIEPFLIERLADRRIVESLQKLIQLVENDTTKSNSRIRVLSAILDLLKTLNDRDTGEEASTSEASQSRFSLRQDMDSLTNSLPVIVNDLEAERMNLKTLATLLVALRQCARALKSVCHIEDWTSLTADNTNIWNQLLKWSSSNGLCAN